jgi:hypothetical protein
MSDTSKRPQLESTATLLAEMSPKKLKSGNFLFHKVSKIGKGIINQGEMDRLTREGYVIGKNVSVEAGYCLDTHWRAGDNLKETTIMIKDRKYKKDYMKWKGNDIRKRNNLADAERLERECQRKREDQEKLDLERKVKEEQELVKGKGKATPAIESSSDSSSKLSSIDEDPKPTKKGPTTEEIIEQRVAEHLQWLQREFKSTQQIVLQVADENVQEATQLQRERERLQVEVHQGWNKLNNSAKQIANEWIKEFMTKNQPTASTSIAPTTFKVPTGLFHPNTPTPHNNTTNEPTFPTLNEGYIDPNPTGQPPIGPGGPPQYVQAVLKACPTGKVVEPSIFDGIPSKFSTWLHQIWIYLTVNTANYTTGWMKTFFVLSYMKEGAANAWAKEYQVSRD